MGYIQPAFAGKQDGEQERKLEDCLNADVANHARLHKRRRAAVRSPIEQFVGGRKRSKRKSCQK